MSVCVTLLPNLLTIISLATLALITPNKAPKSEEELLDNAFAMTGKSLQQIAIHLDLKVPDNQKKAKGWVGELIENYLGATASSLPEPDFQHLGIELKTIPIDEHGKPRESTYGLHGSS